MSRGPVVTGLGCAGPLGLGLEKGWEGLRSLRRPLGRAFLGTRVLDLEGWKEEEGADRSRGLALAAAQEAVLRTNWAGVSPDRLGCTFSSSKGGIRSLLEAGRTGFPNDFLRQYYPDSAGSLTRDELGWKGPSLSLSAACSTGAASLVFAALWLERSECDVCLAGATESALVPLVVSGFRRMKLLSKRPLGPAPFDRDRDGFWMGEGAGALVLETEASAKSRGVEPLARLSGWALGNDASSPLDLREDGAPVEGIIRGALRRAGLGPSDIDYVNAHGTGTKLNDRVEAKAIRSVFGDAGPWVSSTKGATGHLLGAAAAVEAVYCVQILRQGWAPPTLGLADPDPDCGLRHVPPEGTAGEFRHVLNLNYGLGGHLSALVFSRFE